MLAGCSSTLLSPRHRLRSESPAQLQACHFPSMSTQRLDLPCSFPRKDGSRSHTVRPVVGLSIEKPVIEAKTGGCSLRQNIKLPRSAATEGRDKKDAEFWEKNTKSLRKRFADEAAATYDDEDCLMTRVKRRRSNGSSDSGSPQEEVGHLSLGQLGSGSFWFQPGFNVPQSVPPLPPLSNIPWFASVVTEVTDLGEKNVETSGKEASGSSSTSSDSHGLVLRLSDNPGVQQVHDDIGNGSTPPTEIVVRHNGGNNHREQDCIELVGLLVACVEQIGSNNIPAINHCIARLGELASPRGSPIHRLIAYYTEALALRVSRQWPHIFSVVIPRDLDRVDEESGAAWRLLNQVSPIPKFIHFTSNEILLRAFEGKDRVHIIDFDIKQGLQWPSLFQSLASRASPARHVRITGIGESKQELIETGERLAGFAEAFNLAFEFHPVVDRLEDVRLWMLHVKEKETVAVNCVFQMHKMLYDGTGGTLKDFLGLIRSTNAEVVVMAEQETAQNEHGLEARLCNSLKYYSAVFDSIDSSLPLESPVRMKIEEMFAREIRNIVSCEGRERFERHEIFSKWKQLMEQGGFHGSRISERELFQGQMLLRMYSSGEDYRVEMKESSSLTLSWLDQPLYTVSAWSPVDVAGSSSSYRQPS